MQIPAQRGFDRRNERWIDIELRNERTGNGLAELFWVANAFEHSLRTVRETFTLFIELTQDVQTRSLLGEGAV